MTYELLYLRQLIEPLLNAAAAKTINIVELEAEIKNECLRILGIIQQNILYLDAEKSKSYLIQHQKAIYLMLDELQKETNETSPLKIAIHHLDHLLMNLKQHFPFYFDYQTPVTQITLKKAEVTIKNNIRELSKTLALRGVDKDIIKILETIFNQLLISKKLLTYHQTIYIEIFFEEINSEFGHEDTPIEILDIISIIVSRNFNHPAFYHFCCGYFNGEIAQCENITDQFRTVNFLKKIIQQIFKVSDSPYNQRLSPIDESLLRYLEAELDYLKSIELIAEERSTGGLLDASFKVTFTVRQLAIFIYLQVESEIIIAQSPKVFHQYVTKHHSTLDKESFSEKSFKNAYYNNARNDVEKVIEKITIILALAQEKY